MAPRDCRHFKIQLAGDSNLLTWEDCVPITGRLPTSEVSGGAQLIA